jgi:hypothetical protein
MLVLLFALDMRALVVMETNPAWTVICSRGAVTMEQERGRIVIIASRCLQKVDTGSPQWDFFKDRLAGSKQMQRACEKGVCSGWHR